jgi:hypothetical protein
MLIAFFEMEEIVRSEFLPWSQAVNSAFYKEVLQSRRDYLTDKTGEMV